MISEKKRKISIIGAGFVGATTAYALMNSGIATEICSSWNFICKAC